MGEKCENEFEISFSCGKGGHDDPFEFMPLAIPVALSASIFTFSRQINISFIGHVAKGITIFDVFIHIMSPNNIRITVHIDPNGIYDNQKLVWLSRAK